MMHVKCLEHSLLLSLLLEFYNLIITVALGRRQSKFSFPKLEAKTGSGKWFAVDDTATTRSCV